MHVFVTGASGSAGRHVIPILIERGHTVTGMARTADSATQIKSYGAQETVIGDLDSCDMMAAEAAKADAVIHMAFAHDLLAKGQMIKACELDRNAINAMGDALVKAGPGKDGKPRVLMIASGTLNLDGSDERASASTHTKHPRAESETVAHSFGTKGLRTLVVRLAPVTHDDHREHMFIKGIIDYARKEKYVPYVGDGQQLWPSTHMQDAAVAMVLGIEKAPAGVNLHPIAEEGIPIKDIAEKIAGKMGIPTKSMTKEEVQPLGFLGIVLCIGNKATSEMTREWLGWSPKGCTLFEQMDRTYKF